MKTLSKHAIAACAALALNANAQSPAMLVYLDFTAGSYGSTYNEAIDNAWRAAEISAASAGYGACQPKKVTYWQTTFPTQWNAIATVVCSKDTNPTPPPPPPPWQPATILPVQRSADGANHVVMWRSPNDCTRHALNRRINGGGWQEVYKGGATSWQANVIAPATYDYRVLALCSSGPGTWSEIASLVVSSAPAQPTPPQTTAVVGPDHTITWSASPGANSYRLEREAGDGWESVYIGPNTSWSIVGAPVGTYRYRVVACANGTCSAPSGITELRVVADMTPIITYLLGN